MENITADMEDLHVSDDESDSDTVHDTDDEDDDDQTLPEEEELAADTEEETEEEETEEESRDSDDSMQEDHEDSIKDDDSRTHSDDDNNDENSSASSHKRKRDNDKWLREVKHYQSTTNNLIPMEPFSRLVREIGQDYKSDLRWTNNSIKALQTAAEDYLVRMFKESQAFAVYRKVETVCPRDMEYARKWME